MAYNNSRKPVSQHVYEDTMVWQCSECQCWSRMEFILVGEPECPLCHAKMVQELKNVRVD
ncbi:MAG: cold-shock protein [Alicyclobacillaceae bacterium]|uniref:cold-shock protein n=1 Tax=Alicyclobacillus sp. SP_1 TaxID=2942475 RepID=UPI0021588E25|nr:cold-shock protein [Alicyclobacillus sp. SP_1]MCY0888304.1 cold-shock protein [Alicyclobacillaceae bacterium]MCY0895550.1 cold-shock protein [Alicyclobacillaceae bacterium]